MACIIGLMFFASCNPETFNELLEQKPNIEFVENDSNVQNNATVYVGTELIFQVKMEPNATSSSPLKTLSFTILDTNGNTLMDEPTDLTTMEGNPLMVKKTFVPESVTTLMIEAVVEDAAGKKNSAVMNVTCIAPPADDEFIGNFAGQVSIICDVTSDNPQLNGQQLNTGELPAEISLSCDADDNALASFLLDGTEIIISGKRNGNKYTFDQFQYTTTVNFVFDIDLNINITMTGVLEDGVLTVSGDANGTGSALFNMVQANLQGHIEGQMEKIVEE